MKRYLKSIFCGISGKKLSDNKYCFNVDFEHNSDNDAIKFISPYYETTSIANVPVCWFGYEYCDGISLEYRNACGKFLENVKEAPALIDENDPKSDMDYSDGISLNDLSNMIERSIRGIQIKYKIDVDTIIYPKSVHNNLAYNIARCVKRCLPNADKITIQEVLKSKPSNIVIDIEECLSDIDAGVNGTKRKAYSKQYKRNVVVDREMLSDLQDKINNQSDFSIYRDISPVFIRNYVKNIFDISKVAESITKSQALLIVDDNKTTGASLVDIVNQIRVYNKNCEIFVFTLTGRK